MASVADLIRRSLQILGVLASGEPAKASDLADGLATLNDMLDSWAGESLVLFTALRSTYTLTPSLSPHTIGVAGTFNTTRPVAIERASLSASASPGSETPLDILTDAQWQEAQNKTSTGAPAALWVESSYPLMKLHLLPVPAAADTLVLYTRLQLGRFTSHAADLDLPPGYPRALRYNLAKEMAPEYGVSLSPEAIDIARDSKATLKRLNQRPNYLRCDPAVTGGGGFNLVSGDS